MIEDTQLLKFYIDLTPRQRKVVQLVSVGLRNRQIAGRLNIASSVVAEHLTNIYADLGTLDGFSASRPNRYTLICVFVPFFMRHPELRE
jgi:DNA-binding NarL/FixJ family response regulator